MKKPQKQADVRGTKTKKMCTNVDGHEVAVAQRVHVLQHVTFIEHGILQTQLTEKAAVAIVSYCHVIPAKRQNQPD